MIRIMTDKLPGHIQILVTSYNYIYPYDIPKKVYHHSFDNVPHVI